MTDLPTRLRTEADGDIREYARDSLIGIHPDQNELHGWATLMEAAADEIEGIRQDASGRQLVASIDAGERRRTHARVAELEVENARLREALARMIPAAQAVFTYDGDDAKPPITDLLLVLEAETAGARAILSPASSPIVKTEE